MTEIKQSLLSNAGNGVFATKAYNKGDYICFYDGEDRDPKSLDEFAYSIANPSNGKPFTGFDHVKNKDGVGQIINDSCMFELNDEDKNDKGLFSLSSDKINKKINDYKTNSVANSNVGFMGSDFKIYASKNINVGEELYLPYGIEYWISMIMSKNKDPMTRLYCIIKNNLLIVCNNQLYFNNVLTSPSIIFEIIGTTSDSNLIKGYGLCDYNNKKKIIKLIDLLK